MLDALTVAAQLGVLGLLLRTQRRPRVPMRFAASISIVVMGIAALNVAGVSTPTGAASHEHEQSDAGDAHSHAHP